MGEKTVYGNRRSSPPGLVILCWLICCSAQAGYSQELTVSGSLRPEQVELNETAVVRFELEYSYAGQIQMEEPELPSGVSYDSGPFVRPVRLKGKTVIEYTLRADMPGRYIVPPFFIRTPSRTLKTAPLSLFVKTEKGERDAVPLELGWEAPAETLYAGQAFPVTAWLRLTDTPDISKSLILAGSSNLIIRPIEALPAVRRAAAANMELYNVPLQSYMVHADKAGRLILPGGKVIINGMEGSVPELPIVIDSLPEIGDGGTEFGVGDVTFSVNVRREEVEGVNIVTAELVYAGDGNLPFFRFPQIRSSYLRHLYTKEEQQFETLTEYPYGYTGSRLQSSTYRQLGGGKAELFVPAVTVYNPRAGEYKTFQEKKLSYPAVESRAERSGADKKDAPSVARKTLPPPLSMGPLPVRRFYSRTWAYLFFIPPLLFIALGAGFSRLKRLGPIAVLLFLVTCSPGSGGGPALSGPPAVSGRKLYVEAYQAANAGQYGRAVYALRRLHRFRPMDMAVLNALETVEELAGAEHQIHAAWRPHPDLFYWSALIFLSGAAGFLWFRRKKGKKILFIAAVISIMSIIGLIVSARRPPFGVVRRDEPMLVVPSATAKTKLVLSEGTTIEVREVWKNYYQVQTGDGILGWVEAAVVLVQE